MEFNSEAISLNADVIGGESILAVFAQPPEAETKDAYGWDVLLPHSGLQRRTFPAGMCWLGYHPIPLPKKNYFHAKVA